MNEQIEKALQEQMERFRSEFQKVADAALADAHTGLLPYVLDDTIANAQTQAEDMVRDIISGNFKWDGDYIELQAREYSPRIRIAFSKNKWDALRDAIIDRMPTCPKDAKIAALQMEVEMAHERGRY